MTTIDAALNKDTVATYFRMLQQSICDALEQLDSGARFGTDTWVREDEVNSHGGGGQTRVLSEGKVFEQAGVGFSEVHGTLPAEMSERLLGRNIPLPFYATGMSLVIHPFSPMVPTIHSNVRYLEVGGHRWFGGGTDLTPYYLFEEDAKHFHQIFKTCCEEYHPDFYPTFKKQCDEYFYLPHRKEARGIGGIFYDYLGREDPEKLELYFAFTKDIGKSFIDAYGPIVERRKSATWNPEEKEFQLIRRGRYVEFNLLYDRGTLFGLKTNGRTESILMSLPPTVKWQYGQSLAEGSREAELLDVLQNPRDWV